MVPGHPFNEMKPNSGSTQMELSWFADGKTSIAIFQQKPCDCINKARMIARLPSQRWCFIFYKDSGSY
jgi:hypothetical protein